MSEKKRLPSWLKMQRASGENYTLVKQLVTENNLNTICTSGNCPNKGECWNAGTATLMILGDICTRSCKFCGTKTGKPLPVDINEPAKIAQTIKILKLKHCVLTSVDRDDLPDGGSTHWANVITAIKKLNPGVTIEVLIPDFKGVIADIDRVIDAAPDVISHNIETVRSLTAKIRSVAKYDVSLKVLNHIAFRGMVAKSGLMLGLGEKEEEVLETMNDLHATGCRVLTIGQYLAPTLDHMPVVDYVTPAKFDEYREKGMAIGFDVVESSPLVRSSYHAEKHVLGGKIPVLPTSYHVVEDTTLEKPTRGHDTVTPGKPTRVTVEDTTPGKPTRGHDPLTFTDLGNMAYKKAWEYQEKIFNLKVAEKGMKKPSGERLDENEFTPTPDHLIFVEHDHVYTLGKSGSMDNLLLDYIQLQAKDATFYKTDRGGDITYHGPGQLVGYPILDLEQMGIGVKEYIFRLEESVIKCLSHYGINGQHYDGATGVWLDTDNPRKTRKICAIGVKVNRSITMHGFALNINTDLSYFNHINPCGFTDKGVTSISNETGKVIDMAEVKELLLKTINEVMFAKAATVI